MLKLLQNVLVSNVELVDAHSGKDEVDHDRVTHKMLFIFVNFVLVCWKDFGRNEAIWSAPLVLEDWIIPHSNV